MVRLINLYHDLHPLINPVLILLILLQFEFDVCSTAFSSAVYGPTGTKLFRKVQCGCGKDLKVLCNVFWNRQTGYLPFGLLPNTFSDVTWVS